MNHLKLLAILLIGSRVSVSATRAQTVATDQASRYFAIEVVDAQTGRGVPLVELKTVSNIRYYTDSAGLAAIDDPALMGRQVFFTIFSHGYEHPADGFGMRGARVDMKPGGSVQLKIKRINIAERLYRITGEGIYHDSVLLGKAVPIQEPLLNAQVTGQDSSQSAVYRGKIYCFWGDTGRQSYPLGHFGTAGATADLPRHGGLDPSVGINLHYFAAADGFSRPMTPQANGMRWIEGLGVVKDKNGVERLVCRVSIMKSLEKCLGRQLLVYDDARNVFVTLKEIPIDCPLQPFNHSLLVKVDGVEYLYFGEDYPNVRVRATLDDFQDPSSYEGFTCLTPQSRYHGSESKLDRDASGRLVWSWKRDTPPLGRRQVAELIRGGKMTRHEAWFNPIDVETGKPIEMAASSVSFNGYRHKYVAICSEFGGRSSNLGEIWYGEADKPEGPWKSARKIVTHDRYSFYNPVQDAYFNQDSGRVIYFEGTYATTFSREGDPTPRYDYNQIMYRLDLSDSRLNFAAR